MYEVYALYFLGICQVVVSLMYKRRAKQEHICYMNLVLYHGQGIK